jgi:nucleotide-binding universal stress UspA family protein
MTAKLQNILVAIDTSDASNRALDVAAEMAKSAGGKLTIVNVATPLTEAQRAELGRIERELVDATDILAQRTLNDARQRAGWSGLPSSSVSTRFRWGEPAEIIIASIIEEKVDAVVVGRRGRGQLAGLLLGSVSQKLATLSPCAVVIVP